MLNNLSFNEPVLPTVRQPDWKYSDLRRSHLSALLAPQKKTHQNNKPPFGQILNLSILDALSGGGFVFVNGRTSTDFSSQQATLQSVPMSQVLATNDPKKQKPLDFIWEHPNAQAYAYTMQLNKYFNRRDVFLLHYITEPDLQALHLSIQVTAPIQVQLTEIFLIHEAVGPGFNHAATTIHLGAGARVQHTVQVQGSSAYNHCIQTKALVSQDADYQLFAYPLASDFARHEIEVELQSTGASCEVKHLNVVNRGQHVDVLLNIDHHAPKSKSHVVSRSLVGKEGRGSFSGKMIVHPGASHAQTHLNSKCLLLDPTGMVHNTPQFEIYHDEVSCYHGATVGCLDQNALFYLLSRGISAAEAKKMLVNAFADRVLEPKISNAAVITEWIHRQLGALHVQ